MLQMLRQKLERIPIVKIGIALTLLPHLCPELNFPILQGNDRCTIGKSVPDAVLRLLLRFAVLRFSSDDPTQRT